MPVLCILSCGLFFNHGLDGWDGFEPFEPFEPLEPLSGSKTKTSKNPLRSMQDVSNEPLMLHPSENPQASLDIFSHPHHHPCRVLTSIARR